MTRSAYDEDNEQADDVFSRGTYAESSRIAHILKRESSGGFILLCATVLALILSNSPASSLYFGVRETELGFHIPGFEHLVMPTSQWAADGLLVVFFFLTGLELKKEFVLGDLRNPQRAIVPVAAAFGGVIAPALIFFAVNHSSPTAVHGWAIPTATDIAFAVAVITAVGSHLPSALRTFLLTLAVVDDLIAIFIIAVFYTHHFKISYLLLAIIPIIAYLWIAHRFEYFFHTRTWAAWVILLPLGIATWALFLESGIHATISGVLLGFCIPVKYTQQARAVQADAGLAEVLEKRMRPISSLLCIPLFAFFAAGVSFGGPEGLIKALRDPVSLGIIGGLVLGKSIGITLTTWLITRLKNAHLDPDIQWIDILCISITGGIGFTVSLLIAELSFPAGSAHTEDAKIAILVGSITAALISGILLSLRNKAYRDIEIKENIDENADGIPDVFSDDIDRIKAASRRNTR
ncbi:Na+/H+ antiporter NhaA [Rothia sp. P13129]|uniref:Na+/H+ antiporter NhaA n=1 Tax=unclassified Rothia (in: high G+C Gram-positive bacteria) TaxID=2689056 RepID=UPI003ACA6131